MNEPPPRYWAGVRSRLYARWPRLLASLGLGVVVFTTIAASHGAPLLRSVIFGFVAIGILIVVVVVFVGAFAPLRAKGQPPGAGSD